MGHALQKNALKPVQYCIKSRQHLVKLFSSPRNLASSLLFFCSSWTLPRSFPRRNAERVALRRRVAGVGWAVGSEIRGATCLAPYASTRAPPPQTHPPPYLAPRHRPPPRSHPAMGERPPREPRPPGTCASESCAHRVCITHSSSSLVHTHPSSVRKPKKPSPQQCPQPASSRQRRRCDAPLRPACCCCRRPRSRREEASREASLWRRGAPSRRGSPSTLSSPA